MALFDGKYPISYLTAIAKFALSPTAYEIFSKDEKRKNFDLENEGQFHGVEKLDLRHSTRNDRIHISEFFRILATWTIRLRKKYIHTH